MKSDVALKEVTRAASLNKRFAPIVCRRIEDAAVPEALRRLNFIFFDDPTQFKASADKLAEALHTDIGWIRRHTEFGEAARRWAAAGRRRPQGLLLRSPVLEEAERWVASRPQSAPAPTEETLAFITESRRAAIWQRRRVVILAAAVVSVMVSGLLSWWQQEWLKDLIYPWRNVQTLTLSQEKTLRPKGIFKECTDCPEMVVVTAGSFKVGYPPGMSGSPNPSL